MTMPTVLQNRGVVSLLSAVASAALVGGITWGVLQSRISLLECKAQESALESRAASQRLGAIEATVEAFRAESRESMTWVKEALRDLRDR